MRSERVLYIFDDVPVKVDGLLLQPFFNMITITSSKDVNKWIDWLSREVGEYLSLHGQTYNTMYIVIWNTGYGTWCCA